MTVKPLNFGPVIHATFLERPNRFLVRCRLENGRKVEAFMPNPGRMGELMLAGVRLHLTDHGRDTARKTRYTCLAVDRDGASIFLHTHVNNAVAEHLLRAGRIPGLEQAEVVRSEVRAGHSRFDFLLREEGRDVLAEVKSVTLFHNRVAMFPDAVTERGRRHLLELAAIGRAQPEAKPVVLFLVHSPKARWFMPDYHTDLAFSRTLLAVREDLRILPVALRWSESIALRGKPRLLTIPWEYIDAEARDRGNYLVVARFRRAWSDRTDQSDRSDRQNRKLTPGWYITASPHVDDLTTHLRRLRPGLKRPMSETERVCAAADAVAVYPVRGSGCIQATMMKTFSKVFSMSSRKGWFHFESDPHHLPAFQSLLLDTRLHPPT
ncbi:MAG: hypothetical protein AMXMBFR82_40410 [Candidatus Hydrogenedentota bacterium]